MTDPDGINETATPTDAEIIAAWRNLWSFDQRLSTDFAKGYRLGFASGFVAGRASAVPTAPDRDAIAEALGKTETASWMSRWTDSASVESALQEFADAVVAFYNGTP